VEKMQLPMHPKKTLRRKRRKKKRKRRSPRNTIKARTHIFSQ
tara:strand:+ start:194 stop:319 length:126 start_codon:yes stop_codon:yes gene_type:complete